MLLPASPWKGDVSPRLTEDVQSSTIILMPDIIPYDHRLKDIARKLRKESTLSEILLWQRLKNKQIKGYIFLRQKPILTYIVDFYCPTLKLAIEIDGASHELKEIKDERRQKELEKVGVRFIRFTGSDVKKDPDATAIAIAKWIDEHACS